MITISDKTNCRKKRRNWQSRQKDIQLADKLSPSASRRLGMGMDLCFYACPNPRKKMDLKGGERLGMGMAKQLELISVFACCSTRATKSPMKGGDSNFIFRTNSF